MFASLLPARRHPSSSKRPKKAGAKAALRPDIQGLRALAVVLVIADHMIAYPSGGFVGVDVFFVISGFVITASLLREHSRTGRISFADFYRRRARRILPLSVLVLLATVIASWSIYSSSRSAHIAEDGLWSLFFGANWHFALDGTNYMEADGVVSPLQHFWSLAVEEQFYVAWPWLVVLMLGTFAARRNWGQAVAMKSLATAVSALAVASFAFAMWETAASPTFAYFSTVSRAWELASGALLAVLTPALLKMHSALRAPLAWMGLAAIAWSAFWITPESAFPGPWASLPVVGAMMVIAAGTGGDHVHLAPLTNRVARYLGDISFSLYLWHFPAIVLIGALIPLAGPIEYLMVLGVVLGLSALSYYFLEDPIRHSQWLEPKKSRTSGIDTSRLATGGVVGLGIVTAVVTVVALATTAPAPVVTANARVTASPTIQATAPSTPAAALQLKIEAALAATAWPALQPSIDELGPDAKAQEWAGDGCLGLDVKAQSDPIVNAQGCVYGNPEAAKTVVVLGDSMAISYVPGIRAALEPMGYKVLVYTVQQCPAEAVSVLKADKSPHPQCAEFRRWALGEIRDTKPDLVIMTSNHGALMADGSSGDASIPKWSAGAKETFAALQGAAKRAVVLPPPPGGKSLDACATRVSRPADCLSSVHSGNGIVAAVKAEADAARIEFVDTTPWFCAMGSCPAFVGTTPVYADASHLTAAYSTSLAPLIAELIETNP